MNYKTKCTLLYSIGAFLYMVQYKVKTDVTDVYLYIYSLWVIT